MKCIHPKTSHAAQANKKSNTHYLTCNFKFGPVLSYLFDNINGVK